MRKTKRAASKLGKNKNLKGFSTPSEVYLYKTNQCKLKQKSRTKWADVKARTSSNDQLMGKTHSSLKRQPSNDKNDWRDKTKSKKALQSLNYESENKHIVYTQQT